MSIESVDMELCTGCGICVDSCPTDVLRMDNEKRKAVIQYPDDCTFCRWCMIDCPEDAISADYDREPQLITSWG
jgi:NAD-dependent dihydropyrimidine dehydrogenase PreA subunit